MIHRTVKQANSRLIIGTLVSLFCIQTSALFVGIGVLRRPLELTPIPVNVHHTPPGVTASAPTHSNFILFIPADSPGKNELPTPVLGQHWPFASNILLSDLSKMERWNRQWRYKMARSNEHKANVNSAKPKQSRVATSANKVVSKKSRIKSNRFFASKNKSELKKKRAKRNTRLRQKQHAESRQAMNTVNRRIAVKTKTSASDQKRSKSNRTRGKKNSAERLARNDR